MIINVHNVLLYFFFAIASRNKLVEIEPSDLHIYFLFVTYFNGIDSEISVPMNGRYVSCSAYIHKKKKMVNFYRVELEMIKSSRSSYL